MITQFRDKFETLDPVSLEEAHKLNLQELRKYFSRNMLVRVMPIGELGEFLSHAGWTYWDYMLLYGMGPLNVVPGFAGVINCNFGQNLSAKAEWQKETISITSGNQKLVIDRGKFDLDFFNIAGEIFEGICIFSNHKELLPVLSTKNGAGLFKAGAQLERLVKSEKQ
jgi:hypothetical protein